MPAPTFTPTARQTNLLLIVGFCALGYALYLRYLVVEQAAVGLACQAGLHSFLCTSRHVAIALFSHSVFGTVALAAAALNLIRPSVVLLAAGLAACAFGIVLYNVVAASFAAALLILSLARPARAAA